MSDGGQDRAAPPPLPDPLPLPVVDNHTHVDIARGGGDRPDLGAVIEQARRVGVDRIMQIGCDLEAARWTVDQAVRHPEVLGGVALHPNEVVPLHDAGALDAAYAEIERLAAHPRVRVVGETGLDYFRTGEEGHALQHESFRWHIDLAKRLGKALQIHDRDSHEDVLRILAEEGAPEVTVLHCFSGDMAMARECVERGYYLSFAGTVTFKSAKALRDALSIVPLDRVLVETDAPYLTPHPYRGATNAPYLIPVTLRSMATTLTVDVPTLCRAVSDNAERIYGGWA